MHYFKSDPVYMKHLLFLKLSWTPTVYAVKLDRTMSTERFPDWISVCESFCVTGGYYAAPLASALTPEWSLALHILPSSLYEGNSSRNENVQIHMRVSKTRIFASVMAWGRRSSADREVLIRSSIGVLHQDFVREVEAHEHLPSSRSSTPRFT